MFTEYSYSGEIALEAIGFRGGLNSDTIGIPPTEKEDFVEYDVFAAVKLPGHWKYDSGWEVGFRLTSSMGLLRGGGDKGFISTISPGIVFRKPEWRLTIDGGPGVAFLSQEKYGTQDIGGPFQIVGHGGLTIDLTDKIAIGWRFHHISDAGLYGGKNRGVDLHLYELSYTFDSFPLYRY